MTIISDVKTNFTAGEISSELLGRGDLRAYANGALTLRNVFIRPTGGVVRRAGLGYIDTVGGEGRLISFEFSTEQTSLLAITDLNIDIYSNGTKLSTISAPWSESQIGQIVWTQSADTLLIVHPDVPPRKLVRQSDGSWQLSIWEYFEKDDVIYQPYYKFAGSGVTLTPSGTSGTISLTSSEDVFAEGHEGTRLRIGGKEVEITDFDSPTVVTANVIETLSGTSATIDWQEQAFSPVRGYPISVAFHQDRLVIGGSRDLPNRLWFSKSGDLFNFDMGEGLDDEAIEFAILSDQVNAIRGIFSGRHLQVFTSGAEWMVTGSPLTPTSVQLNRQTRTGSVTDRYIQPVSVDGATMFVSRNRREIREFIYTDIEQAYNATDLAILSRHVIGYPIDQDFDTKRRLLFLVRDDGKLATLTIFRSEEVAAWTLHETDGEVKSVAVVGEEVYLLVKREGSYFIEIFDDSLNFDSALRGESEAAKSTWNGLDHLEGESVSILADGAIHENKTVIGGSVTLDYPASSVEIGLPYTHVIEPLPPAMLGFSGNIRKVRLIEAVFRLQDTYSLKLDTGSGIRDVSLRESLGVPQSFSGDARVRAIGWKSDGTKPLWKIEQNTPFPFALLSVAMELKTG